MRFQAGVMEATFDSCKRDCLLASAKTTNIIGPVKDFDNRTLAGKDASLLRQKLQKQ